MPCRDLHTSKERLHDVWILSRSIGINRHFPHSEQKERRTERILSSTCKYLKHESNITGITPNTIAFASFDGAARSDIIDGGSSWWISFAASDSHTAFTFLCNALVVICRSGPGGKLRSVMSAGSAVIAIIRPLIAYLMVSYNVNGIQ